VNGRVLHGGFLPRPTTLFDAGERVRSGCRGVSPPAAPAALPPEGADAQPGSAPALAAATPGLPRCDRGAAPLGGRRLRRRCGAGAFELSR
jgi:hypothetical protein